MMQQLQIKYKTCYIDQNGSDGPIILWGMYPHHGNEIAHMWECLMETVSDQDFLLCAFQVEDWNGNFSPWKAPAAFGDEDFKGHGSKTLRWLINNQRRCDHSEKRIRTCTVCDQWCISSRVVIL